jgi:hypothetical protein
MPKDLEFEEVFFGKYKGQLWSYVPKTYLLWMMKTEHLYMDYAQRELEQRKTRKKKSLQPKPV